MPEKREMNEFSASDYAVKIIFYGFRIKNPYNLSVDDAHEFKDKLEPFVRECFVKYLESSSESGGVGASVGEVKHSIPAGRSVLIAGGYPTPSVIGFDAADRMFRHKYLSDLNAGVIGVGKDNKRVGLSKAKYYAYAKGYNEARKANSGISRPGAQRAGNIKMLEFIGKNRGASSIDLSEMNLSESDLKLGKAFYEWDLKNKKLKKKEPDQQPQQPHNTLGLNTSIGRTLSKVYGQKGVSGWGDVPSIGTRLGYGKNKGKEVRKKAIEMIRKNRLAYERGYQCFTGATGNVSLVKANPGAPDTDYFYVERYLTKGHLSVKSSKRISHKEAEKIMKAHTGKYEGDQTWCNLAASQITEAYDAPNLQYHKGKYWNANKIYKRLENGDYNTTTHIFQSVKHQIAEKHASKGGLAIASIERTGHGHIAVLTGGYKGKSDMDNLNIFQAGSTFGYMTLKEGFRGGKPKFYIWRKK